MYSQYHSSYWQGDARDQGISSTGINLILEGILTSAPEELKSMETPSLAYLRWRHDLVANLVISQLNECL